MKINFLLFIFILIFSFNKEIILINYEFIVIMALILLLTILIKIITPQARNFFHSYKEEVSNSIKNPLYNNNIYLR